MDSTSLAHYGVKGMKWGVRRKRNYHDDYQKAHSKKRVSEMSDRELRERNNRLQMEQQYAQLTKKKNRGAQAVKMFVAGATTIASVASAYNTYKKYGGPAVDKAIDVVGDLVIKGIDLSKPLA